MAQEILTDELFSHYKIDAPDFLNFRRMTLSLLQNRSCLQDSWII